MVGRGGEVTARPQADAHRRVVLRDRPPVRALKALGAGDLAG
ncbi:hypothetical protein OHS71_02050 [Streptomyces sp. NBC_00377]|nr:MULTISPECIES: hypothetical protein [unclassified Streptomyces]